MRNLIRPREADHPPPTFRAWRLTARHKVTHAAFPEADASSRAMCGVWLIGAERAPVTDTPLCGSCARTVLRWGGWVA